MGALDEMGFTYGEPRGGLYVWANTTGTGIPALELSSLFLEDDVLIFPGNGFGENWGHFVRMTLLQPIDVLAEAVTRMKRALAKRHAGVQV
jgi:aspartate/methionine/tyrosine aminotransferase